MVAPDRTRTAPRTGSNIDQNTGYNEDIDWDQLHHAYRHIPEHVRNWMEFESPQAYNPLDVLEFKNEPVYGGMFEEPKTRSWDEVFHLLKEIARDDHRKAFGGVHPGLDQPRQVW